jgi:hypothetical protein
MNVCVLDSMLTEIELTLLILCMQIDPDRA